jgi:hypothetical protein
VVEILWWNMNRTGYCHDFILHLPEASERGLCEIRRDSQIRFEEFKTIKTFNNVYYALVTGNVRRIC